MTHRRSQSQLLCWVGLLVLLPARESQADAKCFQFPLQDPNGWGYKVTQNYAAYGVQVAGKYHTGVDIGVGCGKDVRAVADGDVIIAGVNGGWGNVVLIKHNVPGEGARYSQYAHLSSIAVGKNGVSKGQVIGKSGTTGNSTGCHLHFEMKVNGNLGPGYSPTHPDKLGMIDPAPYINSHKVCETCECSGGQSQSDGCGQCGKRTRGCDGCKWGGWSGCNNEGPCSPGQGQSEGCGFCGTHSRTCTGSCQWGDWGECQGQGECGAGTTSQLPCGECGYKERSCSAECHWGEYAKCVWLDPEGGTKACGTGLLGQCGPGYLKCLAGTVGCVGTLQTQAETCDGIDNDCDGALDEGLPTLGTVSPAWGAALLSFDAPSTIDADATAVVTAKAKNVGTETWPAGLVVLRAAGPAVEKPSWLRDESWPGLSTAAVLGIPVLSGETATFSFTIHAPSDLKLVCPGCAPEAGVPLNETFTIVHTGRGPFACPAPYVSLKTTLVEPPPPGIDGGELASGHGEEGPTAGDDVGTNGDVGPTVSAVASPGDAQGADVVEGRSSRGGSRSGCAPTVPPPSILWLFLLGAAIGRLRRA